MRVTKIKIKNLFGVKEYEADGKSVELVGENGVGKTSVIDSIKYALTNSSDRKYIVRNGQDEGEIIIETDSGLSIHRKARSDKRDYKMVKNNGVEVRSPEAFLRDIFVPLQLQPIEFMEKSEKEQNAIILDMIEFDWDLSWIKDQFGEIPPDVDYGQNILAVLNEIQAENGYYYQTRQDINRDIRNKRAFVEDIAADIPEHYDVKKWEEADLSTLYRKIETIRKENGQIENAKQIVENRNNKVRKFQADREIEIATLEREQASSRTRLEKEIERMTAALKAAQTELDGLEEKKQDKLAVIEQTYKANVAKYDAMVEEYREYAEKAPVDYSELQAEAETTERMKRFINEYRRMVGLQKELEELNEKSSSLTAKIEKARSLPGEILEKASIPIKNLTVKDGIPLINGLPISNLSDGEKLDVCIDVAIQKPNSLQIILIDGIEKLSKKNRDMLYKKCKDKGLQIIATRTNDSEDMTVIEL